MQESRSPEERRSRFILAGLPLGIALVLLVAILALLAMTMRGGRAAGPRAELRFTTDCPAEWAEHARQRGESVGIEELEASTEGSEVVLRGVFPDARTDEMAALLTAPGRFAVRRLVDGEPTGEPLATEIDVVAAFFEVGLTGHAYVQVDLQPNALARLQALQGEVLGFYLDGAQVGLYDEHRGFRASDLHLQPSFQTSKEEVLAATNWTILLRHGPAPCAAGAPRLQVL